MPRDADGHRQQRDLGPPPLREQRADAVKHRAPHQGDGNDFGAHGYGAVFAEIADVFAEVTVRDQPFVKPRRRADPEGRRQQQKRRRGQQRDKDADDTQHERNAPQYGEENFHGTKIA